MTVFNELWARGNWDAIVYVVADKGYDYSCKSQALKVEAVLRKDHRKAMNTYVLEH